MARQRGSALGYTSPYTRWMFLKAAPLSVPAVNARSARVLILLVAPGHLVFLYTINSLRGGHTTLTAVFIIFYMVAALLQVHMNTLFTLPAAEEGEISRKRGPGFTHEHLLGVL